MTVKKLHQLPITAPAHKLPITWECFNNYHKLHKESANKLSLLQNTKINIYINGSKQVIELMEIDKEKKVPS